MFVFFYLILHILTLYLYFLRIFHVNLHAYFELFVWHMIMSLLMTLTRRNYILFSVKLSYRQTLIQQPQYEIKKMVLDRQYTLHDEKCYKPTHKKIM